MSTVQINTTEDFRDMADTIILNIVYKIVKTSQEGKDLQSILSYIKSTCGEDASITLKEGFTKIIDENISGIKVFKADLIQFLMNNNGKKFDISIKEKNEDNSVQSA